MRRRSRAAGTAVSTQDWKTGGRRIALSDLYMRSFDRPFGCFRLRPPYARDPQGPDWPPHGLCLPLAEGSLGGAVSEKVSGKPPNSLTSRTVSGLPPGLVPDAETSFRTAGADPSPVCRCAPRLPMKGHGQGKGGWRKVDKIGAEWRDFGSLARVLSLTPKYPDQSAHDDRCRSPSSSAQRLQRRTRHHCQSPAPMLLR